MVGHPVVRHVMRSDRTADHAPGLASDRFARTRQDRSPAAVRATEGWDAVTVLVSTSVPKVDVVPTCRVYEAALVTLLQSAGSSPGRPRSRVTTTR